MPTPSLRATFAATLLCALAGLLAAACGGGGGGGGGADFSNQFIRERDGIRLVLASDKAEYQVGDTVTVRAEVQNVSGGDVLYGDQARPGDTADPFQVVVNSGLAGRQVMPPKNPPAAKGGSLADKGKFSIEVQLDQLLHMVQTPEQAPEGTYSVSALIYMKSPEADNPAEITASLDISLKGGKAIVTPDLAIESAVLQDEVKAWFEGRGTNVICAWADRGLFYNSDVTTGATAETFDVVYQAAIQNGDPYCSMLTDGDTWLLLFSDPGGAPPNRISVHMDLHTSDFIRLEEGGPVPSFTPLPSSS